MSDRPISSSRSAEISSTASPSRRARRGCGPRSAAWAPTSTPAGGVRGDEHARARRSSPGRRSASAGCRRTARAASTSMPGVRTSYSSTIRWVSLARAGPVDQGALGVGRLGLVAEDAVLPERRLEQQAVPVPVLGDVADAVPRAGAGWSRSVMSSSPSATVPAVGRPHAHDRLDQLGLAVALDAGDAEHLAAVDREARCRRAAARPSAVRTVRPSTGQHDRVGDGRLAGLRATAARCRPSARRAGGR